MAGLYKIARPLLFALPPETSHGFTIRALNWGFAQFPRPTADPEILSTSLWGLHFSNPVGVAAGLDKNAEAPKALLKLGFGLTEVGTLTPLPQEGNPRPRLFRLREDRAVINRLGFNNRGLEAAARRLEGLQESARGPVGVNVGANRDSPDPISDYATAIGRLSDLADYFVINVSSPNTPGLRELQSASNLRRILTSARAALESGRRRVDGPSPPILVKVAPDLEEAEKEQVASLALELEIDGLVVSNTTIKRPEGLRSSKRGEAGGLSGAPLFEPSTQLLFDFYNLTKGKVPLVGVGGIASGRDAYQKIRAGASLVQLYTALIFEGPGLISSIKDELATLLRADGFGSISQAVGADHRS